MNIRAQSIPSRMDRPSRGLKKYIRREKANIRRKVQDPVERERLIGELYQHLGV